MFADSLDGEGANGFRFRVFVGGFGEHLLNCVRRDALLPQFHRDGTVAVGTGARRGEAGGEIGVIQQTLLVEVRDRGGDNILVVLAAFEAVNDFFFGAGAKRQQAVGIQIGRASCRERVCSTV